MSNQSNIATAPAPIAGQSKDGIAFRELIADEDGRICYAMPLGELALHKDTTDCGWIAKEWFCHATGIPKFTFPGGVMIAERHATRARELGFSLLTFMRGELVTMD